MMESPLLPMCLPSNFSDVEGRSGENSVCVRCGDVIAVFGVMLHSVHRQQLTPVCILIFGGLWGIFGDVKIRSAALDCGDRGHLPASGKSTSGCLVSGWVVLLLGDLHKGGEEGCFDLVSAGLTPGASGRRNTLLSAMLQPFDLSRCPCILNRSTQYCGNWIV